MNRKKIIEKLNKQTNRNEYGCVMLDLNFDKEIWDEIQSIILDDDIYNGNDEMSGFGREKKPHVTILYGCEPTLKDSEVEEIILKFTKPEIVIKSVSTFEHEKFDVLKLDVKSKDLHSMNKLMKSLPHTNNFPNYQPHITIAYMNKGIAKEYAIIFNKYIEKIDLGITPNKILYSKVDRTKKKYDFK